MNDLEKYFLQNKARVIHKFHHYFEIYERHLARFRNQDICIVEIGVGDGGSLQMWRDYFGAKAKIVGIDISVDIQISEPQIRLIHGDQSDGEFLRALPVIIDKGIDILIDDGSHINGDQVKTFEALYHHLKSDGVYICEDLQTSYQDQFGGGYLKSGTFIERMKAAIDELNAWAAEPNTGHLKNGFTRTTHSMHFYPYMVVIEKRPMDIVMRSPVVSGGSHVQP